MRFVELHNLFNNEPVAVNIHLIGFVRPIQVGDKLGAEVYIQGQPSGETLKVRDEHQSVLNKIAMVSGEYELK